MWIGEIYSFLFNFAMQPLDSLLLLVLKKTFGGKDVPPIFFLKRTNYEHMIEHGILGLLHTSPLVTALSIISFLLVFSP